MSLTTIISTQQLIQQGAITSENSKDLVADERNAQLLAIIKQLQSDNALLNEKLTTVKKTRTELQEKQQDELQPLTKEAGTLETTHATNQTALTTLKATIQPRRNELEAKYNQENASTAPYRAYRPKLNRIQMDLFGQIHY